MFFSIPIIIAIEYFIVLTCAYFLLEILSARYEVERNYRLYEDLNKGKLILLLFSLIHAMAVFAITYIYWLAIIEFFVQLILTFVNRKNSLKLNTDRLFHIIPRIGYALVASQALIVQWNLSI